MEMEISFPGGKRVTSTYKGFSVKTDQPNSEGGDGSAPEPFDLFLSSIGTCAGIYVLGFCKQRGLPTDGIRIVQRVHTDPQSRMIGKVDLEIQVPGDFPEKYRDSLVRSAELCAVKKHIERPPQFDVFTKEVSLV